MASIVLAMADIHAWGIGEWFIAVIIFLALCMIAYIGITKGLGITIPQWILQVFGIAVACVVLILVIRFVASL